MCTSLKSTYSAQPYYDDIWLRSYKGNSNFELGTAICYENVENYFLTIIKHIAVPSSKLEFPFIFRMPQKSQPHQPVHVPPQASFFKNLFPWFKFSPSLNVQFVISTPTQVLYNLKCILLYSSFMF